MKRRFGTSWIEAFIGIKINLWCIYAPIEIHYTIQQTMRHNNTNYTGANKESKCTNLKS